MPTLDGERLTLANCTNWRTVYSSTKVVVKVADLVTARSTWGDGAYRVDPRGGRAKTIYGESAWSDAERYASDFDRNAWGCTR